MRKTLVLLVLFLFFISAIAIAFEPSDPLINDFFKKTYSNEQSPIIRWIFSIFDFFRGGVTGYVGYAGTSGANLTIWDETDAGMPFAGQIRYIDENIFFFANFTNSSGPLNDTVASLEFCYGDECNAMPYNDSSRLWQFNKTFLYFGIFNWSVNATSAIQNLTANDTVVINNICLNLSALTDNYIIKTSRTICSGTHQTNNTILFQNVSSMDLDCDSSVITNTISEATVMRLQNASNISIRNCVFNSIFGEGINISDSAGISVSGCSFNTTSGNPIFLFNTSNSSISTCVMFNATLAAIAAKGVTRLNIANINVSLNNDSAAISLVAVNNTAVSNLKVFNSNNIFGIAFGDIAYLVTGIDTEWNNSLTNSMFENISNPTFENVSQEVLSNNSLSTVFISQLQRGMGFVALNQINFTADNIRVRNLGICGADVNSVNSSYNNIQLFNCSTGFGAAYVKDIANKRISIQNFFISGAGFGLVMISSFFNSSSSIANLNIYNSSYALAFENSNVTGAIRLITANSSTGIYAVNSSIDIANSFMNFSSLAELNASSSLVFINVTANKLPATIDDDLSLFTVKWLLGAEVRDALSNLLSNANVTASDVFNNLAFSAMTNSSGKIPVQNLAEFYQNSSGTTFATNYTINASKDQYILPFPIRLNLTQSRVLSITLLSNQSLIVNSPRNGTYFNASTINLTYSIIFSSPDKCWFFNTTNIRANLTNCTNTTFYAADGLRNITVYANDTFGNISFVKILFYVDTVFPSISSINVSGIGNTTATINWTTSEEANSAVNYGVSSALGTIVSQADYNLSHSAALTGLSNHQIYQFNVTSCDRAGNCISSGPGSFSTLTGNFQPTQLHIPTEDIIIRELVASELTPTPQKVTLTPGSKYIFTINSERHEIKLKLVYKDSYAVFEIRSDPKNVSVAKGDTASVDVNNDGTPDMKVHVTDMFMTKVTFELTGLQQPKNVSAEVPPEVEAPAGPSLIVPPEAANVTAPHEKTFFEKYGAMLVIFLTVLVLALISGGAMMFQRRKIVVPAEIKKVEKIAPKMSHMEQLMSKVYGMIKDKKADEDVRRMLDELNLDDNIIKSIIFEMRTKDNRMDQLVKYTKQQFDKGRKVDEVREVLEKAGWAKNIVILATEE